MYSWTFVHSWTFEHSRPFVYSWTFVALFWLSIGLILYTYLGYPLLLACLAYLKEAPCPYPLHTPKVTLLISAYKEEAFIAPKLENSLKLDYPRERLQILVATEGSDDRTAEIVRGYSNRGVELDYSPVRSGKMTAIARAIEAARGEIVVFTDANNFFAPGTLRALVAPFADLRVGAVSGGKHVLTEDGVLSEAEGLYWKYESFIKKHETRLGCCTGVSGEVLAIRRALFENPPEKVIADDFYIAMRIARRGYNVVYAPDARSYERISVSSSDEIERRARSTAGRFVTLTFLGQLFSIRRPLLIWQVFSHKYLRLLLPLAMIGAFIANLFAVIWPIRLEETGPGLSVFYLSPPYNLLAKASAMILAGQVLFYCLAWLGNRVHESAHEWHELKGRGMFGKFLYLPAFLVNSNYATLVGLWRFITRRQNQLWVRVQRRRMDHSTNIDGGNHVKKIFP
jgi:cellulose synthase/poly-beta-1,6-N-acetylglucosamine synthase-like glycosyltransferase